MSGVPAVQQNLPVKVLVVPRGPTCTVTLNRNLSVMGRKNAADAVGQAEQFRNGSCHAVYEKSREAQHLAEQTTLVWRQRLWPAPVHKALGYFCKRRTMHDRC